MELILLERVENLGQMGDVVKVRPGYARNYLLPMKKALRANEANRKVFDGQRTQLEARNLEQKKEADAVAEKVNGRSFIVIRQASETGHLYGSVSTRDIADIVSNDGVLVARNQIRLDRPLKSLGISQVRIALHPEVSVTVDINIARSDDEAVRQARGENVLAPGEDTIEETDAENAAEFFDEEALEAEPSGDDENKSNEEKKSEDEKTE